MALRKYKKLNDIVQQYNGLVARYQNNKTKENETSLKDVFELLKQAANEVIDK